MADGQEAGVQLHAMTVPKVWIYSAGWGNSNSLKSKFRCNPAYDTKEAEVINQLNSCFQHGIMGHRLWNETSRCMETEEALHSKTELEKQSAKRPSDGWRVCLRNWFQKNITKFCNSHYTCKLWRSGVAGNNQGAVINHFTLLCHLEESFHIQMKNVLLKFWVQQDMLNNRAQSEHTFTCSA